MVQRQIERWLRDCAGRPQVVHLTGMRQTGKTTLMGVLKKDLAPNLAFDLQDLVTLRRYETRPEEWVLEVESEVRSIRKGLNVFVDEVQKIPAFLQAIQGLYDRYKGSIKFWICGSSARVLKRHRAETLAGRSLSKTLYPFSQSELLARPSIVAHLFSRDLTARGAPEPRAYLQTMRKWLTQTLLPEPCLTRRPSEALEWVENYIATYLENEIRRENLVSDIGIFNRFLVLLAGGNSQIANYSRWASTLGISSHTVKSYVGILEDTFICRSLPAFSGSFHVQVAKSPKIYWADTGLARAVAGYRHPASPSAPDFGAAVESFAVNEIIKQVEYERLPWRLSYFRTKTGVEVDLVMESEHGAIAIEVKSTSRLASRDFQGIRRLMELDRRIKRGIILSFSPGLREVAPKIYSVPLWLL